MKPESTSVLENQTEINIDKSCSIPVFGYELLRDILIPDLLGKDTPEISYWAGKNLARKFPHLSLEECFVFFQNAGWGQLSQLSERKNELKLELSGEIVERRFHMFHEPCFRLETGFIAQQVQTQKQAIAEASEELNKKHNKVIITVKWDLKDPI